MIGEVKRMKKIFIIMIILLVCCSFLGAQEGRINSVEIGIAGFGGTINFTRAISSFFSVGGAGFLGDGVFAITGVQAQGRVFPLQGVFFLEFGLGYAKLEEDPDSIIKFDGGKGFLFHPGLGWRIGLGEKRSFLFTPALSWPVIFGEDKRVGTMLLRLALGFAF